MEENIAASTEETLDEIFTEPSGHPEDNMAGKGLRLANYLVDNILLGGLSTGVMVAYVIASGPEMIQRDPEEFTMIGYSVYIIYILLFTLFEATTGKTPGKFITRTSVVKDNWQRPSFVNILGRSLSRLIPLESIVYLFIKRPWHDYLSDTYVVKDSQKPGA